jgi:hypothetical protein
MSFPIRTIPFSGAFTSELPQVFTYIPDIGAIDSENRSNGGIYVPTGRIKIGGAGINFPKIREGSGGVILTGTGVEGTEFFDNLESSYIIYSDILSPESGLYLQTTNVPTNISILSEGGIFEGEFITGGEYVAVGGLIVEGQSTTSKWPITYNPIGERINISGQADILWIDKFEYIGDSGIIFSGQVVTAASNKAVQTYIGSGEVLTSGLAITAKIVGYNYIGSGGTYFYGPNEAYVDGRANFIPQTGACGVLDPNDPSTYLYRAIPSSYSGRNYYAGIFNAHGDNPDNSLKDDWYYQYKTSGNISTDGKTFTLGTRLCIPGGECERTLNGELTLFAFFDTDNPDYPSVNTSNYFIVNLYPNLTGAGISIYSDENIDLYNGGLVSIKYEILYDVVIIVDTTQAIDSNRIKIFVKPTADTGSYTQTSFFGTYPAQNEIVLKSSYSNRVALIGGGYHTWGDHFVGFLSNTKYLDGTAVSSDTFFTSTNYGQYGYCLQYQDTLNPGADSSPNAIHFEPRDPYCWYSDYYGFREYSYNIDIYKFTFYTVLNIIEDYEIPSNVFAIHEINKFTWYESNSNFTCNRYNRLNGYFLIRITDIAGVKYLEVIYALEGAEIFRGVSNQSITKNVDTELLVYYDSKNTTAANRIRAYIDGSAITWNMITGSLPVDKPIVGKISSVNYGLGVYNPAYWIVGGVRADGYDVTYSYNMDDWTFNGSLKNTIFVSGILIPYSEFSNLTTFKNFGANGWFLNYGVVDNIGRDAGPNSLDFESSNNFVILDWTYDNISSIGFALNFELITNSTPIRDLILPFYLYSGQDINLSIQLELLIDAQSLVIGLKLYGDGESVTLSLPFILYNLVVYTQETYAHWGVYCLLDNIDVSDKIIDEISIENEEDSSAIAELYILPNSGVIDPLIYIGKNIELHWRQYDNQDQLVFSKRRFYGMISEVEWIPDRRVIKLTADTQLPSYFDGLSKIEIANIIGGLWSDKVWDNTDDSTGWTYAQERLSTTENCIWHDENWILRISDIKAKRSGNDIISDFIFTDSARFHETLNLEYAQRSEMINEITCEISYKYQRKRQRTIKVDWTQYGGGYNAGIAGLKSMICDGNSFQICQRSMVEGAASSGDWVVQSPINFDPLWGPQIVQCGSGMYDIIVWGVGVTNVYTPIKNEDGSYKKVVGVYTGADDVAYRKVDLDPTSSQGYETATPESVTGALCTGAHWSAARRWVQDIEENYTLMVQAPDSISTIGKVTKTENYTIDANVDNGDWENSLEPYKDNEPSLGKHKLYSDDYWNTDEHTDWATQENISAVVGGYVELDYKNITTDFSVTYNSINYEFEDSKSNANSKNGWYDKVAGILYIYSSNEQIAKGASHVILNGQSLTVSYMYADGAIVNRAKFEDAQEVILAAAKGDILRAHRLNTVSFKVVYQPQLDLSHTVQIQTPYLSAAGKVKKLRDVWSIETGEASTEIFLAISRHNGNGLISETSDLAAIERPVPTEPETYIPTHVRLNNYIGGRTWGNIGFTGKWYDGRADGKEDPNNKGEWLEEPWAGFMTNYESPITSDEWAAYWSGPSELFNDASWKLRLDISDYLIPYQFIMKGPDISEEHTNSVVEVQDAEYDVAIPQDLLIITA